MKPQQPVRADSKLICPFHRKAMNLVCHKCPMWLKVAGTNENGEVVDQWRCSLTWLPILMLQVGQQVRQAGTAIESLRDETTKAEAVRKGMLNNWIESKVKNAAQ